MKAVFPKAYPSPREREELAAKREGLTAENCEKGREGRGRLRFSLTRPVKNINDCEADEFC